MPNILNLTIAIPVKNEEKNLPGCLNAIGKDFAKRIVIIDSGSMDRTREIAQENGVDFINFEWNGKFPKKRNWFLRNYNLETKWILFLDADEYLTEAFKRELGEKILNNEIVGYWLSYTIYFLGKKLKGGYPLRKLALFQVGSGEYEKINEERWSQMDMEVHEHPILNGKIGSIGSKIDHRDFQGLTHYLNKQAEYAKWEAFRSLQLNYKESNHLTFKQKIKYRLLHSVWIGPVYFIGSFLFLGGFRDGFRGIAFAILKMAYFTQVFCKIQELKK